MSTNTNQTPEYTQLAEAVLNQKASAERNLRKAIRLIRGSLNNVEEMLNNGQGGCLNTLGELQNQTSIFEASVGALARLHEVSQLLPKTEPTPEPSTEPVSDDLEPLRGKNWGE